MSSHYSRVLLKISGEMLSGKKESGIDPEFVIWLSKEIKKAVAEDVQMAIVVGGGNFIRGANFAGQGIERATADYMGMLGTAINGQALMDILQINGVDARTMSAITMDRISEPFIRRKAIRHLEKGRVVILVCGTGKPYVTTDTAAITNALELDCEVVLKATKVDGVYNKDPEKHSDAVKLKNVSFQEALENQEIHIMDKAAIALAMEQQQKITVFNLFTEDSIAKVVRGESVGSSIK